MYSGITKIYDRKTVGHPFYVKDRVFFPPLPRDLADLKARIDAPTLTRV
jgi:hypothetical protein